MSTINFDALGVASGRFNTLRDVLIILGWIILPFVLFILIGATLQSKQFLDITIPLVPLLACVGFIIVIVKSLRRRSKFIVTTTDKMRRFALANGWNLQEQPAGWNEDGTQYVPEGYFQNSNYRAHPLWSIKGTAHGSTFLLTSLECTVNPRSGKPHMAFLTVLTLHDKPRLSPSKVDKDIQILTTRTGTHVTLPYAVSRQSEMRKLFAAVTEVA